MKSKEVSTINKIGKHELGEFGENTIVKICGCPKCKKPKTLKRLPNNFKCADIICDFCGYIAQVKSVQTNTTDKIPDSILGAAWGPQKERMDAGIYIPLFLVLVRSQTDFAIYYLSADLQRTEMFLPRKPLSENAKRAGWQGFNYDMSLIPQGAIVKLFSTN